MLIGDLISLFAATNPHQPNPDSLLMARVSGGLVITLLRSRYLISIQLMFSYVRSYAVVT